MYYIFDLDGTLADGAHRQHFLECTPRKWAEWNAACSDDQPNHALIRVMELLLHAEHDVAIMTGRCASTRKITGEWLRKHCLVTYPYELFMRPEGDYTEDTFLKQKWLEQIGGPQNVAAVFEDRKRMVDMWRGLGVQCWQVAEGNF